MAVEIPLSFRRATARLTINEVDSSTTPANTLSLGAGLSAALLVVTGDSAGNILLSFGGGDTITLVGGLLSGGGVTYGVQELTFADGSILTYSDILGLAADPSGNQSTLYGDSTANVLDGNGAVHSLTGGGGGDTFIFNAGYGYLAINESDSAAIPNNQLLLGAGSFHQTSA
jgi:hypothetical protein